MSDTPRTDALRLKMNPRSADESILLDLIAELERALAKYESAQMPDDACISRFDDFLNEPPQYENERMVRDYRYEAYEKWREVMAHIGALRIFASAQKVRADEAELKFTQPPVSEYDAGMGTTPGMWEMLSEAVDGEKLPDSLNRAIYALRDGQATVRSIK